MVWTWAEQRRYQISISRGQLNFLDQICLILSLCLFVILSFYLCQCQCHLRWQPIHLPYFDLPQCYIYFISRVSIHVHCMPTSMARIFTQNYWKALISFHNIKVLNVHNTACTFPEMFTLIHNTSKHMATSTHVLHHLQITAQKLDL